MTVTYNVAYVYKPPTWERVGELVTELEKDERRLCAIEQEYAELGITNLTYEDEYQRLLRRMRDKFQLAETMVNELEAREDG